MAENNARIAKLKQSFEIFDTDGSGALTAEEVLVILTRMGGPSASQLTEEDAKEFIAEVRSQPPCARYVPATMPCARPKRRQTSDSQKACLFPHPSPSHKQFDRDGDGMLDLHEFICAMGVVSDAYDGDGDGVADMKVGAGKYDGDEEEFAAKLASGENLQVAGMEHGQMKEMADGARKLQK